MDNSGKTTLKSIKLVNFKSIREQTIELGSLNVLIGANGSGKSNLLSFFELLREMVRRRLQQHLQEVGGSNTLLHYGAKVSPYFEVFLEFDFTSFSCNYHARWAYGAGERLVFSDETIEPHLKSDKRQDKPPSNQGLLESMLTNMDPLDKVGGPSAAGAITNVLRDSLVYQFHDTSERSEIRMRVYSGDNRYLKSNGENLAAFLYRLRRDDSICYGRIRATIQQIAPFFDDFDIDPKATGGNDVRLNWRERNSDHLFGPHQLSDGTLRAMCLIALLLQPFDDLPTLVVLDEPELGLHPAAIHIIASLMKQAAMHCQVIIATQSTTLLDEFEPAQVIVVERDAQTKETTFERLDPQEYAHWLEKYSLHDLWERNVIGGGPFG